MLNKRKLTSNQLIEAAFELFAQHGIEKMSLAMIAAGSSEQYPYEE